MQTLNNQTALVTGAGSGIGQDIAVKLAQMGANVVITGRKEAPLKETAALHGNISYIVADAGKTEDVSRILAEIKQKFNRLDIIVNNAGMAPVTPIAEQTLAEFDTVFNINVRACGGFDHAGSAALKRKQRQHCQYWLCRFQPALAEYVGLFRQQSRTENTDLRVGERACQRRHPRKQYRRWPD